jgi:hypothetical protein
VGGDVSILNLDVFLRDFFNLEAQKVEEPESAASAEPETPKSDRIPELISSKIKACLAHVRTVTWGEAHADCEIADGDIRLLVRMSVKSLGKVEKKP